MSALAVSLVYFPSVAICVSALAAFGLPKPVKFPDPVDAGVEIDGLQTMDLTTLIELKLASGMTSPDRPRDFDDVIQLVRANGLLQDFSLGLNPWVRAKFLELWGYAQRPTEDY